MNCLLLECSTCDFIMASVQTPTPDKKKPRPLAFSPASTLETYRRLIDRTAIVNCIGSPRNYNLDMIQAALNAADVPPTVVLGICPRFGENRWEILFVNEHNCQRFVTVVRHLTVNSAVGLVECPITNFFDDLKCA